MRSVFAIAILIGCGPFAWAGDELLLKTGLVETAGLDAHWHTPIPRSMSGHSVRGPSRNLPSEKSVHYYVVQFKNKILHEDQLDLTTLGAQIVRYLPDDAFVVRAEKRVARTIAGSSSNIAKVVAFEPRWKVSPDLLAEPSMAGSEEKISALIRVFPHEDLRKAQIQIEKEVSLKEPASSNAARVVSSGRTFSVWILRSRLLELAAIDSVEWIEPNPHYQMLPLVEETDQLLSSDPASALASHFEFGREPVAVDVPLRIRGLYLKPYQNGTKVIGSAWGASVRPPHYNLFSEQLDEFCANHLDLLLIFPVGGPGSAKNVMTVGAENVNGSVGDDVGPADLNALGAAALGPEGASAQDTELLQVHRIKPEIIAPISEMMTGPLSPSLATLVHPEVEALAFVASQVRDYLINDRKIVEPSSALLRAVLFHTAIPKKATGQAENSGGGEPSAAGSASTSSGYGEVDLSQATQLEGALLVDDHAGISTAEVHRYKIHVSAKSNLKATLVYTDAPPSLAARKKLVNDLDLVLVDSAADQTSLSDHTNSTKTLESAVTSGDYEIWVRGFNVPLGQPLGQPYALVVSVH